MTDAEKIADGKVGIVHYTLRNDDGEELDSSRNGGEPLAYLHGAQNIVPGLEQALEGRAVGETFSVTVAPADGYGERSGEEQAVPRAQLPADVAVGMQLVMESPQGGRFPVWVTRLEKDEGFLTVDHPLAGQNLNFEVEVVGVRDATGDELAHGHAHGIDGTAAHHHHAPSRKRSLARKGNERRRKRR